MQRQKLYAALTITISTLLAMVAGEILLAHLSSQSDVSDNMDAGLIRYHSRTGWTLTPGWQGRHQHTDYKVDYTVDQTGLKSNGKTTHGQTDQQSNRVALIVGDSFTFGLGVLDEETFTAKLNASNNGYKAINGAVPGYSPEQSLLRAQTLSRALTPNILIMVIYLGNDLIDIGQEFAVQAEFAKPYARIDQGKWHLVGIPVPTKQKPAAARQRALGTFVIKQDTQSWIANTHTGQRMITAGLFEDPAELDIARLEHSVQLLEGVIDRFTQIKADTHIVILLPGRNAITQPRSITARYQRLINKNTMDMLAGKNVIARSLVSDLSQHSTPTALYFQNDGHLTAKGHTVVSQIIEQTLPAHAQLGDTSAGEPYSGISN